MWRANKIPWSWVQRVVDDEPAREKLEELYWRDIDPPEACAPDCPACSAGTGPHRRRDLTRPALVVAIFTTLGRAALHGRGRWRYMKPSVARRYAQALRTLRGALEAVEAAAPYAVTFKATSGDADCGAITWSVTTYACEWIPAYLEACVESQAGVVTVGQPKDRVLWRCAAALDALVRERTGHPADATIGYLLKAAFPTRFHNRRDRDGRRPTLGDDHADAVRELIRRAQGKRR
jgi:hypothetical protein